MKGISKNKTRWNDYQLQVPLLTCQTGSLYIWELSADFFHEHGQVVDLVLVDAQGGDTGHVGELDVRGVVVTVQDQSAQLLQLTQQSRVPIGIE